MIEYRKWNDLSEQDKENVISHWDSHLKDFESLDNATADLTDILYKALDGNFYKIMAKEVIDELIPRRIARLEKELKELYARSKKVSTSPR